MATPMMQQYREAKERYPGMLLFFRNGDFYELFEEDAEIGARVLGITLTKRDKQIPMAGVPHHALDRYLARLLQAGHRVAVCEQMEEASQAKGIIRREVTRVVTPGTITEEELLDPREPNHLAALSPAGGRSGLVGLAWVDLSTGLFQAVDAPSARFEDDLARLSPSECMFSDMDTTGLAQRLRAAFPEMTLTPRFDWTFDPESARAVLFHHFGVSTLAGYGFDDAQPCLVAAGALLLYLQETLKASLAHLARLRPYRRETFLLLDEVTRRSLELTRTMREGSREGSLLSVIDRTVTPMGSRLFQEWLSAPLADRRGIEGRFDAVGELAEDGVLRQDLRELLGEVLDLQRLTARASTGRASPRDLGAVSRTLRLLPRFKAKVSARRAPLLRDLETRLELCPDLREALDMALVDDPPVNPKEGGILKRGYDPELDELYKITHEGRDWMASFQAAETTRTGIPSLKIGYNMVDGYYVEITHTHSSKVPKEYQHRKTLKNATRYVTPELLEYAEKVLGAQEKIYQREYDLFVALRDRVAAQTQRLLSTGEVLATLDVLASMADLAISRQYCRPRLSDTPELTIRDGRHPVLDQTLPPGTFVPNDVSLGNEAGRLLLITGPNMAGKSIYIRQAALIVLLAQTGSFVPAREATVGVTDRIFTRVGASDEVSRGQSTFMVEMTEAANILNNATTRSLVILDEIGRGTSTYDGVSLAWAITEYLHERNGCRALFATHYHELAELADRLPNLRNFNVLVHEGPDGIVFLHKIAPGSADKSYGIHVAQLAGVPEEVLERARQVLTELESRHVATPDLPAAHGPRRPRLVASSLFANSDDPVLAALRDTDLETLTTDQALAKLRQWQRELRSGE
jgi:DNA mismatch repair protein MutS